MVTIYDIANYCGLSTSAVSKALRNHSDISAKTKERVQEAAKELGYNPLSVPVKSAKPIPKNTIAIVYQDKSNLGMTHDFFAMILEGIRKEAQIHNYDILLLQQLNTTDENCYVEYCKTKHIAGVICLCCEFHSPAIVKLARSELPVCLIDAKIGGASSIMSNNSLGVRSLVSYLISQGHTKIGFIHGQIENTVTEIRLEAFLSTLKEYGIEPNEAWIKDCNYYDPALTKQVALSLLIQKDRPTALLLPDDYSALGFYQLASELHLCIPDDISIAGYDGIDISRLLSPTLTTIQQGCSAIGSTAVKKLLATIELNVDPSTIWIDGELFIGGSIKKIKNETGLV